MQRGCGLAGHLSGRDKTKGGEEYWGLSLQYEEMLRKPYYMMNSLKKGRFRRIIKAVFKHLKGSGRGD